MVKKLRPIAWWMHVKLDGIKIYNIKAKPDYGSLVRAALAVKELQNGGVFIDAERGIVFAYVKDGDGGRKVLDTVKGKVRVVLLKGEYTSEQLKSWKDELSREIERDEFLFSLWSGVYPDYTTNKVAIDFEKVDNGVIAKTMKILDKLNIPKNAVVIEKQPRPVPTSRESYIRPLIGGIKIVTPDNPYVGRCTLGFIANRNGIRGFVTAGHCVDEGGSVYQPTVSSSYRVGTVVIKSSSSKSDSAWIRIEGASSSFRIYNQYNTANHYPVFSKMYSQTVGMRVCKGGISTGETCGTISAVGKTVPSPIGTFVNQVEMDGISCTYGDSGAPVYYDPLDSWVVSWCYNTYGQNCKDIYGVFWSCANPRGYYSPIDNIEEDLGYLDVNG